MPIHTFFCLCLDNDGEQIGNFFSIQADIDELVDELKKSIKARMAPKLDYLAANELYLWKAAIRLPTDGTRAEIGSFNQSIKDIKFPHLESDDPVEENGAIQLLPHKTLSDYWGQPPKSQYLHILVKVPYKPVDDDIHTSRGIKRKRDEEEDPVELLKAFTRQAPSVLAEPTSFKLAAVGFVECNRPFQYDTLPITLLQQEFADFGNDCVQEPSVTAIQLLEDLTVVACKWYDNEDIRRDEINEIFRAANIPLSTDYIEGTSRKTDGNTRPVIIPALIRVCKNDKGCAPFQAIAYYANFVQAKVDFRQYTRFPSILMTDVGSHISFYGCLFLRDKILVQPLTPIYDLTAHWTDETARQQIATALNAVLKAVDRLEGHYESIKSTRNEIQREYPFHTSFVNPAGSRVHFTYTGRVRDKLIFKAVSKGGDQLIIKFTKQYSEATHRFLAGLGHAPILRSISDVQGGWKMVVMDHSQYTQLDDCPEMLNDESRANIRRKVLEITQKLHTRGLVHGDIRQTNLLVDIKTLGCSEGLSIHLIDFDWAGQAGTAKYPLRVNTRTVPRPKGVAGGALITKSHDLGMIELLFYPV